MCCCRAVPLVGLDLAALETALGNFADAAAHWSRWLDVVNDGGPLYEGEGGMAVHEFASFGEGLANPGQAGTLRNFRPPDGTRRRSQPPSGVHFYFQRGHAMPAAVAVMSASSVSQALLSGDIETALLAVQTNRTQLLDRQLSSQIEAVQQKNEQAAKLNAVMSAINTVMAQYPKDGDSDATIKDWNQDKVVKYEMPLNQALKDAGITDIPSWSVGGGQLPNTTAMFTCKAAFHGDRNLGDIKGMQSFIQGKLDSLNSTQQMDMMALQSLSNKRNESFDVMTNFIKKMQDGRSSILSNMR